MVVHCAGRRPDFSTSIINDALGGAFLLALGIPLLLLGLLIMAARKVAVAIVSRKERVRAGAR
jgi:hypothetical protein